MQGVRVLVALASSAASSYTPSMPCAMQCKEVSLPPNGSNQQLLPCVRLQAPDYTQPPTSSIVFFMACRYGSGRRVACHSASLVSAGSSWAASRGQRAVA